MQGQVRDSFVIERSLSARVQRLARRRGTSRSFVYREAVEEYLARHEANAITAAIDAALAEEQDTTFVEGARKALAERGLVDEWSE